MMRFEMLYCLGQIVLAYMSPNFALASIQPFVLLDIAICHCRLHHVTLWILREDNHASPAFKSYSLESYQSSPRVWK